MGKHMCSRSCPCRSKKWVGPELLANLRRAVNSQEAAGGNEWVGNLSRQVIMAARAVVDAVEQDNMKIHSVSIVDEKDAFSPDCRIEVATVPRVARSLSDLKPGQVVICLDKNRRLWPNNGHWSTPILIPEDWHPDEWEQSLKLYEQVVILSEAPEPDPREQAYKEWADTGNKFSTRGGTPREIFMAGWAAREGQHE